jgi:hypothetical protein
VSVYVSIHGKLNIGVISCHFLQGDGIGVHLCHKNERTLFFCGSMCQQCDGRTKCRLMRTHVGNSRGVFFYHTVEILQLWQFVAIHGKDLGGSAFIIR